MKIYYGTITHHIDITQRCLEKCIRENKLVIPHNDTVRTQLFSDPAYGFHKQIFIQELDGNILRYGENSEIDIDMTNGNLITHMYISHELLQIHEKIQLIHGEMREEVPEQYMALHYLTGKEKVLEIGANVGRNSLVIATLLEDSRNMVSMECDPINAEKLRENRDNNHYGFHIEASALSKRKLIQKGWTTIPSDVLLDGYQWVNTISYEDLVNKYNIPFDTLVLDCEGAFYYILMDMPEVIRNINMVIVENDYTDIAHKNYVDSVLSAQGFVAVYCESGGFPPCAHRFYEVWKK